MARPQADSEKQELRLPALELMRDLLLQKLRSLIRKYEPCYLSQADQDGFLAQPLTPERYRSFETWLEGLTNFPSRIRELTRAHEDLTDDIRLVVNLYEALLARALKRMPSRAVLDLCRLREDEYPLYVDYERPLSFAHLEPIFAKGNVAFAFNGGEFARHPACEDIDGPRRWRAMMLVYPAIEGTSEDIIELMKDRGYRPAIEREAIAFAERYPHLPKQFPIVAFGSILVMRIERRRTVTKLDAFGGILVLDVCHLDQIFPDHYRFLFVRA